MGNTTTSSTKEKTIISFSEGTLHGCVVAMQGYRRRMEDTFITIPSISFDKDSGFFAIFDGHGGNQSSTFCSTHFMNQMISEMKDEGIETIPTIEQYGNLLQSCFIHFDSLLRKQNVGHSGSTAITCFVTPNQYIIANLGDSRCILSSNGKGIALSHDHKPYDEKEKQRIIQSGHFLINNRIDGDLAVSRSFGDFLYKKQDIAPEEQAVSCIPEIINQKRNKEDNYLVLASDGVWDVFPDIDEFIQVMNDYLHSYESTEIAITALLEACMNRGSKDNLTLILVLLDCPPTPNSEMIQKLKDSTHSTNENV